MKILVRQVVRDLDVDIHLVTARAKQPDSLRGKLRRKSYSDPSVQVTDTIGVRIITYYRSAVDPVAVALKREFQIDRSRSEDKRRLLDLREFGYRSVHLIAKLKPTAVPNERVLGPRSAVVRNPGAKFAGHAWAEIEHEVVYKSGVEYPKSTARQFGALAGTLEILDVSSSRSVTKRRT